MICEVYGPCFLMRLSPREYGGFDPQRGPDAGKVLVQVDWEYPMWAIRFGWRPCEKCTDTDGTVGCSHRSLASMVGEAGEYLHFVDGLSSTKAKAHWRDWQQRPDKE